MHCTGCIKSMILIFRALCNCDGMGIDDGIWAKEPRHGAMVSHDGTWMSIWYLKNMHAYYISSAEGGNTVGFKCIKELHMEITQHVLMMSVYWCLQTCVRTHMCVYVWAHELNATNIFTVFNRTYYIILQVDWLIFHFSRCICFLQSQDDVPNIVKFFILRSKQKLWNMHYACFNYKLYLKFIWKSKIKISEPTNCVLISSKVTKLLH